MQIRNSSVNLFPHETVRGGQIQFMNDIQRVVSERRILVADAPTGIGKTAAVLSKALETALDSDNDLYVIFATPRNSQHRIALETVKQMNAKHGTAIKAVDFVGKQWLCNQEGVENLTSSDFLHLCKNLRKDSKCSFYKNTLRGSIPTESAEAALATLSSKGPLHSEELKKEAYKFCPYEMAVLLGKRSDVFVCDYNHIFSSVSSFFVKTNRKLSDAIVIIDEAHNLPSRIRKLMSHKISTSNLARARKEALSLGEHTLADNLESLAEILYDLGKGLNAYEGGGKVVEKQEFMDKIAGYSKILRKLEESAEEVREQKKNSSIGSIAEFMASWPADSEGFSRVLLKSMGKDQGKKTENITLFYDCMDASVITKGVFDECHSAVLMSGTLKPVEMYVDLLGLDSNRIMFSEYESPFPKENRLNIIVQGTTTKYTQRDNNMFTKIANHISKCLDNLPKGSNAAIFFPSYDLRDKIVSLIDNGHAHFNELPGMSKQEKAVLVKEFVKSKNAILTGAQAGSLAEGIDYPNNVLKMVAIVGLSLEKPDLKLRALIDYYNMKFGKGWEYAYSFPAVQRAIQSSGRCIRSEKDIGVCLFMDERFGWSNYHRIFPKSFRLISSENPAVQVKEFFDRH